MKTNPRVTSVAVESPKMDYPWATSLKIECPVVDTKPGFHPVEYGSLVCAEIECLLPPNGHAEYVGEIQLEKILIQEARRYGVALRDILFERIAETFFPLIFTDEEKIKPELKVAPGWVDLQVITHITIDGRYRTVSCVVRSIQSLIGFLGAKDLVAVLLSSQNGTFCLIPEELEILGFKRIAGTNIAIRDPATVARNPMM
jgi:hypothetical protein